MPSRRPNEDLDGKQRSTLRVQRREEGAAETSATPFSAQDPGPPALSPHLELSPTAASCATDTYLPLPDFPFRQSCPILLDK